MKRKRMRLPVYVIGRKEEGFCWLLGLEPGEKTDDQDIKMARRFGSLSKAARVAETHAANVFELIDEKAWPAVLKEIL